MIAPLNTGLETDLRPWLIPDDAFASLNNAYVFRGRVRKRFGSYLLNGLANDAIEPLYSRLRVNIGTTDGSGDFSGNVISITGNTGISSIDQIGILFSVYGGNSGLDTIFTVYDTGTPATLLTTGTGTATYNTSTSDLVITGSWPNAAIYFYPAQPVMGLITYETSPAQVEPVYAFDTLFAYFYNGTGWGQLGTAVWSGNNYQFFWGYTYRGVSDQTPILYVTNNNPPDGIQYWNGTTWATLSPVLNNINRLQTALIIVAFKNRLLALNVTENADGTNIGTTDGSGDFSGTAPGLSWSVGQNILIGNALFTVISSAPGAQAMQVTASSAMTGTFDITDGAIVITGNGQNPNTAVYWLPDTSTNYTTYINRCRFSQNGSPLEPDAWIDQIPGKGNLIDCPTSEAIVSAEFLKDRLIVFFERSTWEIAYTGNQVSPFVWQKINTELGAESTNSIVPFDKVVLGIGNVGIHACNGINVERVDEKIPDTVFEIHNDNDGVYRVAGIRDYKSEMVWWTFPDENFNVVFPTRILAYNYRTGSWATFDDSITAFGYYQTTSYFTWQAQSRTWEESSFSWNSGTVQSQFRSVLAGNQQGFIFVCDPDENRNAPSLQITNIYTDMANGFTAFSVINHNLKNGDFILVENCVGVTTFNGAIYEIQLVPDANTVEIGVYPYTGTYAGGGTCARVSRIDILTKQYNFYVKQGRNAFIQKVDFLVDKTVDGQMTVDYYPSSSDVSMLVAGEDTGSILGNGVLETSPYFIYPLEFSQVRLWHPVYLQTDGEGIQLRIYLSDAQMVQPDIVESDFQLHAMTFYTQPTASRLQ